jgi:hypothetical protein
MKSQKCSLIKVTTNLKLKYNDAIFSGILQEKISFDIQAVEYKWILIIFYKI